MGHERVCAMTPLGALRAWFLGFEPRLLDHGFRGVEYAVTEADTDGPDRAGQVTFDRSKTRRAHVLED